MDCAGNDVPAVGLTGHTAAVLWSDLRADGDAPSAQIHAFLRLRDMAMWSDLAGFCVCVAGIAVRCALALFVVWNEPGTLHIGTQVKNLRKLRDRAWRCGRAPSTGVHRSVGRRVRVDQGDAGSR